MEDPAHPMLADARREGRKQAEAFEAALRRAEDAERAERRGRLASGADQAPWLAADGESAPSEVARLQRQVEALAHFRVAVLGSRAWRLIEAVRRIFGRAW